ncbi:PREDICTED: zinc-finger homeodomain protein 6-like [Nicotiana attenuata]|uniref:Zinc-finger homeodomain protein 5 n=1 Tax=Nicotiana attenuata TaxID=49451 RepID=A0A1J6INR2_NICAT|nr:PREDICTED: zinc-finger homeodomain protein 6-like [Nicotiana attenuata]OIT06338.1 zinc-finger homeodomain protein 5 [Nicotiana attenuata]
MEQKGQEKEMGMPKSMGYNPSQVHQHESSSLSDRRNEKAGSGNVILIPIQTLNKHNHHSKNGHSQQNSHQLEEERDPNLDLDPLTAANNRAQLRPQSTTSGNGTTTTTTSSSVRYRECLKNHAASTGGHVLDGCGEFMPSEEEEGTPQALKCAACDCHRNFHRRETEAETQIARAGPPYSTFNPSTHSSNYCHNYKYSHSTGPPVMMMTFGGNSESSSEDLNLFNSNVGGGQVVTQPNSKSKKRFRTKFTAEQKERMHEFAEKVGWSIQKKDEQELQHFCNEVGVKRQVFRIWMHNSKQANKKRQM